MHCNFPIPFRKFDRRDAAGRQRAGGAPALGHRVRHRDADRIDAHLHRRHRGVPDQPLALRRDPERLHRRRHQFSARYSYSAADNVDAFGSSATTINYSNNAEVFPNRTHSTAVELNSTFGNHYANKLILGYTRVKDDRGFAGKPFPNVEYYDIANLFIGQNFGVYESRMSFR